MKDKTELYERPLTGLVWQRSSVTIDNPRDYNCVQVAQFADGAVAVGDSNCPDREPLRYTAGEWSAFLAGVRDGEFG